MKFDLEQALPLLERTPSVLEAQLKNLPEVWLYCNEGPETWSAFDILGHLIHGEKTDWIARLNIILSEEGNKTFAPFDRFAMFEESKGKSMDQLLSEFHLLRLHNIAVLKSKNLTTEDYDKEGIHSVFGKVTLSELLSCWVAHDLNHLAQINRVMAKQYKAEVGPWIEFLRILK